MPRSFESFKKREEAILEKARDKVSTLAEVFLEQELRFFSRQFPRRTLKFYEPMGMPVVSITSQRGTIVEVTPTDAYFSKRPGRKPLESSCTGAMTQMFVNLSRVLSDYVKLTTEAKVCVGEMSFKDGERLTGSGT